MKKIIAILLLVGCSYPFIVFSQNDDLLFFTRNNRPSEANFKFKNYNSAAQAYNSQRLYAQKDRSGNFWEFLGYVAGGVVIASGIQYISENKIDKKALPYQVGGIAFIYVVSGGFKSGASNRAVYLYKEALQEKNKLHF